MNILILGSGGREHALSFSIQSSPLCSRLFVAPGNAGTPALATQVDLPILDFPAVANFIRQEDIRLLICGPEEPLVKGLRDYLESQADLKDLLFIGPSAQGALLEGSKDFAKAFMAKHNIPTARYATFTHDRLTDASEYIKNHPLPVVLKADGLAAGKGVIIAYTQEEAQEALNYLLRDLAFGEASSKLVIEEFLDGIELSVFALTDGNEYILLPEAKDYKRIGENDQGPNTGGMGAISPVPFFEGDFKQKVIDRVVVPTVKGLKQDGIPYKGFLFFGLIRVNNEPYVIEYNVRMGDPETEVVIPRLQSDLVALCIKAASGQIQPNEACDITPKTAVTVMMVSEGYPGNYAKGKVISGLEAVSNAWLMHAGTIRKENQVLTSGGRVLCVTALGEDLEQARNRSYTELAKISFDGAYFRRDIGYEFLS